MACPVDGLELEIEDGIGGQTIVTAGGEITHSTAPALQDSLFVALESSPWVVVDLSGVGYVGSDGIRVLMLLDDVARQRGRRFTIRCPPAVLSRLLPILGLDADLS